MTVVKSPLFKASLGGHYTGGSSTKLEKHNIHASEMTLQGNTHSRFRFSLVFFLVFLLTSPTKASSEAKSCVAVTLAWGGVEVKFSLGKNPEFVLNLADCLKGVKKAYSEIQGIIKQLPELIDKVLPVAKKEGLVLLSAYLFYKSFELYNETMILEENVRTYHHRLDALEKKMKSFRDLIDNELIPEWEKGNIAKLEKHTNDLLQRLGGFSAEIQELTQDIRQDYSKSGSNQRFSSFLAFSEGVLCVYVLVRGMPYVSILVCGAALGTAGYSCLSYISLCETLPTLELLEKDSTKLNEEITSYQTKLYLIRIRAELKGEL